MKIEGEKIILVNNCLKITIILVDGKPLLNIEISNDRLSFLPATVKFFGNYLLVWNNETANPCCVRYA